MSRFLQGSKGTAKDESALRPFASGIHVFDRRAKMTTRREAGTALLVLDMISEFCFPDAEPVLRGARRPARAIARLRARAGRAKIPVIYVNDTAGKWESDPRAFVQRCLAPDARGRDVVRLVAPDLDSDFFMFKPKHSAFFGTPLESLLGELKVRRLVLTGITSHQCVLFTAMDAHVREYQVLVPADCVGAASREETGHALFIAERALGAKVARSARLRF